MSDEPEVECSMCGRDGYPPASCDLCHGRARPQPRAHTLSERRAHPNRFREDRGGGDGGLGPKRANVPGADA